MGGRMESEEAVEFSEMTDKKLREELAYWTAVRDDADKVVKEIVHEILCRKHAELHDGIWTSWGFVPD